MPAIDPHLPYAAGVHAVADEPIWALCVVEALAAQGQCGELRPRHEGSQVSPSSPPKLSKCACSLRCYAAPAPAKSHASGPTVRACVPLLMGRGCSRSPCPYIPNCIADHSKRFMCMHVLTEKLPLAPHLPLLQYSLAVQALPRIWGSTQVTPAQHTSPGAQGLRSPQVDRVRAKAPSATLTLIELFVMWPVPKSLALSCSMQTGR